MRILRRPGSPEERDLQQLKPGGCGRRAQWDRSYSLAEQVDEVFELLQEEGLTKSMRTIYNTPFAAAAGGGGYS